MSEEITHTKQGTIIFIPHGGGPRPLLNDKTHIKLITFLKELHKTINKPKAILIISAHWEEDIVTITSGKHPELIYDFFSSAPPKAYETKYPAVGDPDFAQKIYASLNSHGIKAKLDETRGFDHGMFVPLKLMYPEADIPCVQLSLMNNFDAQSHINVGKALTELLDENILILGSGFTFHNLDKFGLSNSNDDKNKSFEEWLVECCTSETMSVKEKELALVNWENAPFARYCHPREEHLLPLHVCFGAGLSSARLIFKEEVFGKIVTGYLWD